jgi:hypothetical protein
MATEILATRLRQMGTHVHPQPILIMGNPKSGTSAIVALLSEMTGTPATIDLRLEMWSPTIDRVKAGTLPFAQFVERNRLAFSRPLVKEPALTFFYDELATYFPESQFVMVIRDPRDNIRSLFNRRGIPGNLSALPREKVAPLLRAWHLMLDNSWLDIPGGTYVEAQAHRWNHAIDLYERHRARSILCRYETFREDKVGEIRRLARELDLAEKHTIDDRVDVQFQPSGDNRGSWSDFFGAHNLSRIETICGERMERFGYAVDGARQ